ncbi:MAG: DUF1127 domain-containing protein [Silicimonas sp.]|nr:DUF1127 domain-containing protein [Silicimonas sp.]NNF91563.1 DUF1127 domain-containing protein [Boseongicola sp.]RZW09923.1 MAG: DUF1127 domain-containing protein [Paracoccaceae bacterium]MBT8424382.1 DUF1127 domain-containing protein [Silicimonas sp.]NND18181.1 DUF1127 domain-containing protein [Silicimonas sp.]
MALIDMGRSSGHSSSLTNTIRALVNAATVAVADWNDTRRTRHILSQLTAHELDDIGLSRGDIDALTRVRHF